MLCHDHRDFYLLCLPFILSCIEKLSLPNLQNAKERPGTWRNTEETLRHCIFNKPCQICSKPTACKPHRKHTVCILNMPNELCARVCTQMQLLHPPQTGHLIHIMHGGATQAWAGHWQPQMINEGAVYKGHMGCEPIISARAGYEPTNELEVGKQMVAMSCVQEWTHLLSWRTEEILTRIHVRKKGFYMLVHKHVHAHRPVIILQQIFLINDIGYGIRQKIMDPNECFCSKV